MFVAPFSLGGVVVCALGCLIVRFYAPPRTFGRRSREGIFLFLFFFKEEDKRRLGKSALVGHAPVEVVVCAVGRVVMLPHCGDDCAIYCLAGAGD